MCVHVANRMLSSGGEEASPVEVFCSAAKYAVITTHLVQQVTAENQLEAQTTAPPLQALVFASTSAAHAADERRVNAEAALLQTAMAARAADWQAYDMRA